MLTPMDMYNLQSIAFDPKEEPTQLCTKCGDTKFYSEFPDNPRCASGKSSWCYACRRIYNMFRRRREKQGTENSNGSQLGAIASRRDTPQLTYPDSKVRDEAPNDELLNAAIAQADYLDQKSGFGESTTGEDG